MQSSDTSLSEPDARNLQWFAVHVKPRHEKQVALAFEAKGTRHFLPLRHVRTRWADRWKDIQIPLFPRYVFCRIDQREPRVIVTTPGVIDIVRCGRAYAPVEPAEIQLLQAAIHAGLDIEPVDYFAQGTSVIITAGPLNGAAGTVVAYKNSIRLVLNLTLLRRTVLAELDRNWVSAHAGPAAFPDGLGDSGNSRKQNTRHCVASI